MVDSGAAAGDGGIGRVAQTRPAAARRFAGHRRDGCFAVPALVRRVFDQLERAVPSARLGIFAGSISAIPSVPLGWVLDPLAAIMLVMVTFLSLLIFIYSLGYMAHDENFTRFFCFMSLFAAAMLGIVIANSLLLLFICWELVGLSSYLLIGFWFEKPAAAAAAKKAFITTRIGDIGLLLGMLWLYSQKRHTALL